MKKDEIKNEKVSNGIRIGARLPLDTKTGKQKLSLEEKRQRVVFRFGRDSKSNIVVTASLHSVDIEKFQIDPVPGLLTGTGGFDRQVADIVRKKLHNMCLEGEIPGLDSAIESWSQRRKEAIVARKTG